MAAAAVPGMISTVLKLVFCTAYVMWVVKRAKNRGEHFEELEGEAPATEVGKESSGPSVLASVLPMLVILLVLWAKVFRRNRRYGSRSGRRYRSSSYRGGRRGR